MSWDREERFRLTRPPRAFWWVLGIATLATAVLIARMRITDSRGWAPVLRKPIFYDVEVAAWWARAIPLLLIAILSSLGLLAWFYERRHGHRIRI